MDSFVNAGSIEDQQAQAVAISQQLEGLILKKSQDPFDPSQLPWGSPDPKQTPTPAQTAQQLSQLSGFPLYEQGVQLASNTNTSRFRSDY
jgi:hypothetical protein